MSAKDSQKWNERCLPRARVKEYAEMLLGPWCAKNNDALSHAMQILYKMCNEQRSATIQHGRMRAVEKLGRLDPADPNGDFYFTHESIRAEQLRKRHEEWPAWKKALHAAFFTKQASTPNQEAK